jgi:iron complex outermembrane receptor protein
MKEILHKFAAANLQTNFGQKLLRKAGFLMCMTGLAFGLHATAASPDTASAVVEGRVLNPVTGDYLLNARISIKGTGYETLTDSSGTYRLSGLPAGSTTVVVEHPGLDTQERAFELNTGQTVRQDFEMTSQSRYGKDDQPVKLDRFIVSANREMDADILANNEQRHSPNIKNVIAADAFGDVSEGNVSEFLKRMPGVSVIYPTGGDAVTISIRGFDPQSTAISVDGAAMPSASYSSATGARGTNTEQISMTDVARVEVIKSAIPSISADFLGGAVNLVTKNSFERSKPQLSLMGTVQFTADDHNWKKTPGPGSWMTRKLRPGYDFSYVNPVSKTFGFTLASMRSNQFGRVRDPRATWEFTSAQGGSEAAPYFRSIRTDGSSRETIRQAHSAGIDWKPLPTLTLKFGFRRGTYDLLATAGNRLTINTGNNPTSYGPTFTQGRSGGGTLVHAFAWTGKEGGTDHYSFSGEFKPADWKIDWSVSQGKSDNVYSAMPKGFFANVVTRVVSPTVRFDDVSGTGMPTVTVRNTAGALIDWKNLANHQILRVTSDEQQNSDEITQGQLNVRREFRLGSSSGAVQFGVSEIKRTVDKDRAQPSWTFVGADGIAQNTDNSAAPFVDPTDQSHAVGVASLADVQWPDLRALYKLYQTNPNYFVLDAPADYISKATNSEWIRQTLSAAYIQGEAKLLKNRLFILGGVRFEKTENRGLGLLNDHEGIYQHDAAGKLIRNSSGNPIQITTDPLELAKLQYKARGAKASQSYDGYYPSVNGTFNITDNLLLRLSYAKTIGRPNFINIIPNLDVDEDADGASGVIKARNPSLKPWEANGYEASLEYYFKSGGVVSAAVFRKDVSGAFATVTTVLTPELLGQFSLDSRYEGWDLESTFNSVGSTRINGIELNWQQRLTFLPDWAKGFSSFANLTALDIDGPGFADLPTKNANWGFSYSRNRVGFGLKWNYQGEYSIPLTTIGANGERFFKPFLTLDVNAEFRFNRRFSCFFNARNLTNAAASEVRRTPLTPEYSYQFSNAERGVKMSAGIKGTF